LVDTFGGKMLKILGLGPGDISFMTMDALNILKSSENIYLRTEKHPLVNELKQMNINFESFDRYYEMYDSFDDVYLSIANEIYSISLERDIVYAVPGNPFVAEKTVEILKEKIGFKNIEFVYGVSFIDAVINLLGYDPVNGLTIVDALNLEWIDNSKVNLFIQTYDNTTASELKLKLMEVYDDDVKVKVIKSAGVKGHEQVIERTLYEMDRDINYDHLTSVFIDKVSLEKRKSNIEDLLNTMRFLRSENGCPWDRVQTHESIRNDLYLELHELLDAIDNKDIDNLEEELGDLLLQVIFHTIMEEEKGYFTFNDVITRLNRKLIYRHPHVFESKEEVNVDQVHDIWEERKAKNKSLSDKMRNLPHSLPASYRALEVQKLAKQVGFDWSTFEPIMDKLREELLEIEEEIKIKDFEKALDEVGDLIFTIVNLLRYFDKDFENITNKTTDKFIDRFTKMERLLDNKGINMTSLSLEELDKLWELAKKN
jgi:tetrapyrrole methylase family protein/MazG family protein